MKYLKILFLAALSLVVLNTGAAVSAQQRTTDDSSIEQRLRDEGLDQAPAPIEVDKIELRGSEPYSGFVDENGNPMSDEEYAEWNNNQKGLLKKYPWLLPLIIISIGAIIFAGLRLKKKK